MAFTFRGSIPSNVVYGNGSTSQNLYTLTNRAGSRVNIYVRRLSMQLDPIAALTSVMPVVRASRATNITGGIITSGNTYDTNLTGSPSVEVRFPVLDGFPLTATAGDTLWQQYASRMHTAAEQSLAPDNNMLPLLVDTQNFILRQGESLLVKVNGAATTSNARLANNWFVEAEWEEEAVTTFAISGTVTLGGSPVMGAIVTVIEADDESMTNQVIVEKVVTDASGLWNSTITSGKVGAAFVQYKSGATYYTAPGSPFLE